MLDNRLALISRHLLSRFLSDPQNNKGTLALVKEPYHKKGQKGTIQEPSCNPFEGNVVLNPEKVCVYYCY